MNTSIITFQADEQVLIKTGGIDEYASDTVSYVEADFALGQNWDSFDSVRAIWQSRYTVKQTVLNHEGKCIIPWEILTKRSEIQVNLVGSVADGLVLVDRLTTFAIKALTVTQDVLVYSGETPISPSQFEEFVDIVKEDADRAEEGALDSEAWAVGERNGTPVTSDDPQYENNAKYWAEQSQSYVGDAQGYAQAADQARANAVIAQGKAEDAQLLAETAQGKAETAQSGAEAEALKSEGYAVGKQNGQAVSSGSPYFNNNAKYYSEQASDSATSAATSEGNAYLSKIDAENAKVASETAQGKSETAQGKSEDAALVAEGYANGEQNGVPVSSGSPYYENNAKYYKDQAWAAVAALDIGLSVVNGELNITYTEA